MGARYRQLSDIIIKPEFNTGRQSAFDGSASMKDNGQLHPRNVYKRILDGKFLVSEPEKTKTGRIVVATCWKRDMKLLVEEEGEGDDGKYVFTG